MSGGVMRAERRQNRSSTDSCVVEKNTHANNDIKWFSFLSRLKFDHWYVFRLVAFVANPLGVNFSCQQVIGRFR